MSGAHEQDVLRDMLRGVGFVRAEIRVKEESREYIKHWMPGSGAEDYVVAAEVVAHKPGTLTSVVQGACKRVGELLYAAWLAQARHHAAHTDHSQDDDEPECCAPGPAKKPLPKC